MSIDVVKLDQLHEPLGFVKPFPLPKEPREKPLSTWKMEVDDAPIFRYVYHNFKPRRHLEFGTWQGLGALFCLEECNASVWTINLPFGESKSGGENAYTNEQQHEEEIRAWAGYVGLALKPGSKHHQTDRFGLIGRHYLAKGYGNRVCQIYCDSRDWDHSVYPADFFDSILIDGGHDEDIVISDTKKALSVLRPGGLLMWHDFCPDEEARAQCDTPRKVVAALESNMDWIAAQLKQVFWIDPSWILLGIKS